MGERMRLTIVALCLTLLSCAASALAEEMQPVPEAPEEQMNSQVLAQCAGFYAALGAIGGKSLSDEQRKNVMGPYMVLAIAAARARTAENGGSDKLDMNAVAPEIKSASSAYISRMRKNGSATDPVLIHDAKSCKELTQRVVATSSPTSPP